MVDHHIASSDDLRLAIDIDDRLVDILHPLGRSTLKEEEEAPEVVDIFAQERLNNDRYLWSVNRSADEAELLGIKAYVFEDIGLILSIQRGRTAKPRNRDGYEAS